MFLGMPGYSPINLAADERKALNDQLRRMKEKEKSLKKTSKYNLRQKEIRNKFLKRVYKMSEASRERIELVRELKDPFDSEKRIENLQNLIGAVNKEKEFFRRLFIDLGDKIDHLLAKTLINHITVLGHEVEFYVEKISETEELYEKAA
jgi:transposase